jgi:hypothetical protein
MRAENRDGKIIIALRNDEILKPSIQKVIGKEEFSYKAEEIQPVYTDKIYAYFQVDENILYVYYEPFNRKGAGNIPFKVINGKLIRINWKEAFKEAERLEGGEQ